MLKKSAVLLSLLIVISANFAFVTKSEHTPEWTLMLYLDGDNNLEEDAINDFLELSSVGSSYDVNILVQFDRRGEYDTRYGNWNDTNRFFVEKNMEPTSANAVQSLGEVDMADPQSLLDFMIWGVDNYAATKYFLIIWDHGLGWEGIVQDDSSGGFMDTPELASAFAQFHSSKGFKIDVVAFDACRMMLETLYELRDHVDYFVGSEKDVPDRGFPYDTFVQDITSNPTVQPWTAAKKLVDAYVAFYTLNTMYAVTLSAIDSSYLNPLISKLNPFLSEMFMELPFYSSEIKSARDSINEDNGGKFEGDNQYDLYYFLENVQARVDSKRLVDLIENIRETIEDGVYEKKWDNPSSANSRATNANGLTIWLPTSVTNPNYLDMEFADDTYWDEFLDLYYIDYTKPNVDLNISYWVQDGDSDGYNDQLRLDITVNVTSNLTVEFYTDVYQFSMNYSLVANVLHIDTITLSDNGYYTVHFYLTNTTGHLLNYSEILNPLSSIVDLAVDSLNIWVAPHPLRATIGEVETIYASITLEGPLDVNGINVSFYMSQKEDGESPDGFDNGTIDASYSGILVGWRTIDIRADTTDFKASVDTFVLWDTSCFLGPVDIWVVVDYPAPGKLLEEDDITNNKAQYWQGNFYVVDHKNFRIYGEIVDENGEKLELDVFLRNLRTNDTLQANSGSSGFEVSIIYPIWAFEGDSLEVTFVHEDEVHKFELKPDFNKSSYKIRIIVNATSDESDMPDFPPVFLIQVLVIIILMAGLGAASRRKKR